MADMFSKHKRSVVMAAIRSFGNDETEGRLLKILWKHRIVGWRRHLPLPGRPDFAFPESKVAVFVDGCFWHGCPKHFRLPKSNKPYWKAKVTRNSARDRIVTRELRSRGWTVLRIWQHELAQQDRLLRRIISALTRRSFN
ncbi:MAG: very short patch repair endonuclease [Planctomycetota bacterium]